MANNENSESYLQTIGTVHRLHQALFLLAVIALPIVWFKNTEIFWFLNCTYDRTILNFFFLLLTSLADGLWVAMIATVVHSIRPHNLTALIIALIAGNILIQSGKFLADFDRPLRVFGEQAVCLLGQQLTVRSFPSGHAFSAGILFMFLRPRKSVGLAIAWLIVMGLAALSRVYVGVHFPRDVLTGFLVAVATFKLAETVARRISFRDSSRPTRRMAFAVFSLGITCIYLFAYHEKTRELEFLLTPAAALFMVYWVAVLTRLAIVKQPPDDTARSGS